MDAFHLKLPPERERFVSHPIRSLAQAYVYREQCQPLSRNTIWHMMIDESRQGQGYGSLAMDQVVAYIRGKPFGDSGRMSLTCRRDNARALRLYKGKGFRETGAADGDEIELSICESAPRAAGALFLRKTLAIRREMRYP